MDAAMGMETEDSSFEEVTYRHVDAFATEGERTWGMLTHLAGFLPFPILAPLIVWLVKRDESPFLDDHGREALNFQISIWLYGLIATFTCVGIVLLPILGIVNVVCMIVMATRAYAGEYIRYPMTIRFV